MNHLPGTGGTRADHVVDLNALVLFAKVAESRSFSEAARRLQLPVSSVSRRIADAGGQHIPRSVRAFKDFTAKVAPTLFPTLPT
ncbi:MAG: LysR family transcriptional regulator [Gemmatimonadaceae bacterium]